jgi:hypothetical protein
MFFVFTFVVEFPDYFLNGQPEKDKSSGTGPDQKWKFLLYVQTGTQVYFGLFPDQDLVEGGSRKMTELVSQKQKYKVITEGRKLK